MNLISGEPFIGLMTTIKKHLETFRKYTDISYLHHFAIIYTNNYKNILYFPNLDIEYNILGKWGSNWYNKSKYILGHIEQDDYQNIIFIINVCYNVSDGEDIEHLDYITFSSLWKQYYTSDPLLNIVNFYISETNYFNTDIRIKRNLFLDSSEPEPKSITVSPSLTLESSPKSMSSSSSESSNFPILKSPSSKKPIKTIDSLTPKANTELVGKSDKPNVYLVCKTDKPDVYWVYNKDKEYISTCLIPNIKTSKYMNDLFSSKATNNFLELELKYHEKTSKYIPVIN
jgi:hypothetical protein